MRLIKLSPSQRVQGRWLVQLEDGELIRVGENEVISFALYSGKELSGEEVEILRAAGHEAAVKEKALSLLAARPLSRKELIDKLTARPRDREKAPLTDREGAERVADRLEELGYLNDGAYARTVVRHYSAKGYGRRRLQEELYRHGVPRDYWEEALEEAAPPEDGVDAFLRKKLKPGDLEDRKALKRVTDALARRGYRWEEIQDGLRRWGAELEETIC